MEKVPCEFCGNTEYHVLYKYVEQKPFCSSTCLVLWREEQELKRLNNVQRAAEAARQIH